MDTPITISSTSSPSHRVGYLHLLQNRNKHDRIRCDDSTSSGRRRKNWNPVGTRYTRSNSNTSLSNFQKVTDWINSIEGDRLGDRLYDNLNRNITDSPNTDKVHIKEPEPKSLILVRCDFNKSVAPSQTYFSQLNSFNCSTPLLNYFQHEDGIELSSPQLHFQELDAQNSKNSMFVKQDHETNLMCKPEVARKQSVDKQSFCEGYKLNDSKSEISFDGYEMPLSVESRKKELCTYLKLMDPSDKKQIFNLQNRRSTRVRNLAAIQERKQLDKEIKELENLSDKNQEHEKNLTMKSFKELNITPTKLEHNHLDKVQIRESELFHFPFPPTQLTKSIENFDVIMKKVVPRYRLICKKNRKCFSKIKPMENVHLQNKTITNKPHSSSKQYIKINLGTPNSTKNNKKHISNTALKKFKEKMGTRRLRKLNTIHRCKKMLRSRGKIKTVSNIPIETFLKSKQRKCNSNTKRWKKIKRKKVLDRENVNLSQPDISSKIKPIEDSVDFMEASSPPILNNSHCEILTISSIPEDHIDLETCMSDINDFNKLSEEHKKCLIESRILSNNSGIKNVTVENETNNRSLQELSPLYGFSKSDVSKTQIICDTIKNTLAKHVQINSNSQGNILKEIHVRSKTESLEQNCASSNSKDHNFKPVDDNSVEHILPLCNTSVIENGNILINHDYALSPKESPLHNHSTSQIVNTILVENLADNEIDSITPTLEEATSLEDGPTKDTNIPMQLSPRTLPKKIDYKIFPYNKSVEIKSLQKSLQFIKKKNTISVDSNLSQEWEIDDVPKPKINKQSHYIHISKDNGNILNVFYVDFNFIICQEFIVSFWMQTPLGNILGSQNMWIPRGHTQRIVLNNKCVQKKSSEMVLCTESTVAYIELWTKEHKSDIREGPVADIFVTLYFWKQRQNGLDKKVLQLENINGFADDVQYCVMKCFPKIIVSWHSANGDNILKRTFIHSYQLAADYQVVSYVSDIEPVDHYVSSLHNIEDCDNLVMGCGENKVTLWNLEHGYIIATIELTDIKTPLTTVWVKCDRSFLFTLQQGRDQELHLIAINGINHSWKKLATYFPAEGFDRLKGVCIENGLLLSFYDQGILCWKAETGEPIEEISVDSDLMPCGHYIILVEDSRIFVKHATTHLLSMSVEDM